MINRKIVPLSGILGLFVLFGSGCMTSQVPVRKKMPGYLTSGDFEASSPFKTKTGLREELAFATGSETLFFDGSVQSFVTVPIPDAGFDKLALNLVEQYKPYAAALIGNWLSQGSSGVIIDLRKNAAQNGSSTTYRIEKANEYSMPLIFRWDAVNAQRAEAYMALLNNIPGLNAKRLGN